MSALNTDSAQILLRAAEAGVFLMFYETAANKLLILCIISGYSTDTVSSLKGEKHIEIKMFLQILRWGGKDDFKEDIILIII